MKHPIVENKEKNKIIMIKYYHNNKLPQVLNRNETQQKNVNVYVVHIKKRNSYRSPFSEHHL